MLIPVSGIYKLKIVWLLQPSSKEMNVVLQVFVFSTFVLASMVAQMVKKCACHVGDPGSINRLRRFPGEGNGNPLQYSCLENPHGQRSLAGYSP